MRYLIFIWLCCGWMSSELVAQPNTLNPVSGAAGQQQQDQDPKPNLATVEQLESLAKQADGIADEALRTSVQQFYQNAISAAKVAETAAQQKRTFVEMKDTAEAGLQQLRSELDRAKAGPSGTPLEGPDTQTAAEMTTELRKAEAELESLRNDAQQLRAEPNRRQQREAKIAEERAENETELKDIRKRISDPDPLTEKPQQTQARRAFLAQREYALLQLLEVLEAEKVAYAATSENIRVDLDLATLKVTQAQRRVQELQGRLETQRTVEAERDAQRAARDARLADPMFSKLAAKNQKLAKENKTLVARLNEVSGENSRLADELKAVEKDFETVKSKVESVGLTEAIGMALRRRRAYLAEKSIVPGEMRLDRSQIRDAQLRLLILEDQRNELDVADDTVKFVESNFVDDGSMSREQAESTARELFTRRDETLDGLTRNQRSYFETLVDLDSNKRRMINLISEYDNYISERVLWIRSDRPIGINDFRELPPAFAWVFDSQNWQSVVDVIVKDARSFPLAYVVFLIIVLPLLVVQQWLRRRIDKWGAMARQGTCSSYQPTLRALAATLCISAVWPSVLFFLAWRIYRTAEAQSFAFLTSYALYAAGEFYVVMEFFRHVCRANGLADAHFGWDVFARRQVRLRVRWMMTSLPFIFVGYLAHFHIERTYGDSLGRVCLIISTLILGTNLCQLFYPKGKFFSAIEESYPGLVGQRLKGVMFAIPLVVCVSLVGLYLTGYVFTAAHLMGRVITTAWLASLLFVMQAMASRLLLINRRRLALERAQQLAQQMTVSPDDDSAPAVTDQPDLNTLNRQSDKLVKILLAATAFVGVYLIWSDVLPALSLIGDVALWRQTVGDRAIVTSLGDVLLACVAAVTTFLAVRNLPGLLELLVLQRLPLDSGARYAITTISRYVMVFVGIAITCGLLGFDLSEYQWIIAAASFGLGFGLQEIFANFVSGIIVLVERPIRVGDIITLDSTTGVVSRIRMRATTVTDWDRKELIVPNRDLVTGRVINWTLSDATNRIVITVGVEYGSDTQRATELLLEAARSSPNILTEPGPLATFEGFSDSSLTLVLRALLPNMDNRLSTIHYLYGEIDRRFKEAGIGIAFPHLDVLVRDTDGVPDATPAKSATNGNGKNGEIAPSDPLSMEEAD